MTDQPRLPDPEKVKQTVANLRRSRLEMELFGLELEEITARIEQDTRQKRLARLRRTLNGSDGESKVSDLKPAEVSS